MTAEEIEFELRREWWLHHGHDFHSLYGDDGEMACNACPADFKRMPLDVLKKVVFDAQVARAAQAPAEMERRKVVRALAEGLLESVRIRRENAAHALRQWEHSHRLSDAIRRDDARAALEVIEYAEPVARWVIERMDNPTPVFVRATDDDVDVTGHDAFGI